MAESASLLNWQRIGSRREYAAAQWRLFATAPDASCHIATKLKTVNSYPDPDLPDLPDLPVCVAKMLFCVDL